MKNYLILTSILILSFQCYSQGLRVNSQLPVNIDANGSSPDQSAMLDVKSTSKGVLVPRMTTSQRNNIGSPAKGLLVFDTNTNTFWFHNGSSWKDLGSDTTLTESQVDNFVNNNGYLTNEVDGDPFNEMELPVNPQTGTMVYYNGTNWMSIPPGQNDDKLCYCNGVPTWGSGTCPPPGGGDGQNSCNDLEIGHLDESVGACQYHIVSLGGAPVDVAVSWTWSINNGEYSGGEIAGFRSYSFQTQNLTPGNYHLFVCANIESGCSPLPGQICRSFLLTCGA